MVGVCVCALGSCLAAICTVVAALCSYVLTHIGAAHITLVVGVCVCTIRKLCFTKITVVILVLILMLTRRRGVFLKLCVAPVADVVAVFVYVLFTGLINKITDERNLTDKLAGGEREDRYNEHYY